MKQLNADKERDYDGSHDVRQLSPSFWPACIVLTQMRVLKVLFQQTSTKVNVTRGGYAVLIGVDWLTCIIEDSLW